jgi:F0F1-type ATP synthase assembly protein I
MARGYSQASYGLSVAFGFVASVIGCWFVGRLLDNWLGTEPWIQVVMAVIGWALGVVVVVYASKRVERLGLD